MLIETIFMIFSKYSPIRTSLDWTFLLTNEPNFAVHTKNFGPNSIQVIVAFRDASKIQRPSYQMFLLFHLCDTMDISPCAMKMNERQDVLKIRCIFFYLYRDV